MVTQHLAHRPTAFTVIIPAHNEEAVIARCLKSIRVDAPADHRMQIIVAANGCHDRTVAIARTIAPEALVLDLPRGSKTIAMNEAARHAQHFPRIFLDADVKCSFSCLAAVAEVLRQPDVMTATPGMRLDLSHADWIAKAYYRQWLRQPYASAGMGGAGCYGISEECFAVIGEFPNIIADDYWVNTRFPEHQRRRVTQDAFGKEVFTVVQPPGNAVTQIRVEARRQIGNKEVHRFHPTPWMRPDYSRGQSAQGASSPVDLVIFAFIKLAAKCVAIWREKNGRGKVWTRDQTSRAQQ